MPKRPPTPPIVDDAKYLSVIEPYPRRPNMQLQEHRKRFARWIGASIGLEYIQLFRSFYYRLISPGCIIIEVDENMPADILAKRLLGEHRWSEFLKNPEEIERTGKSSIFYCTYSSDRIVQKNGWKRVDVKDAWFKDPNENFAKFVVPYPKTRRCEIPRIDDVIQNDLCRPLPVERNYQEYVPPPPPERPPVVGTEEWQRLKAQQDTGVQKRRLSPTKSERAKSVGSTPIPSQSKLQAASYPVSPGNVFKPGSSPCSSQTSSKEDDGTYPRGPPTSSSSTSSSDNAPWTPVDSDLGRQTSLRGGCLESAFEELSLDDKPYEDETYYSVADDFECDNPDAGFPVMDVMNIGYAPPDPVLAQDSLWGDYVASDDDDFIDDAEDEDNDQYENFQSFLAAHAKNPLMCTLHNAVCSKGVCKVYGEMVRKQRIIEREIQRKADAEKRRASKGKKGFFKDSPTPSSDTSRPPPSWSKPGSSAPARALPPHLKAGAPPETQPTNPDRTTPEMDDPISGDDDDDARSESSVGWMTTRDRPQDWETPAPKPLPSFLRRGAPQGGPSPDAVSTIPRSAAAPQDDDARTETSIGWASVKDRPQDWGGQPLPKKGAVKTGQSSSPAAGSAETLPNKPAAPNAWKSAWDRAPSISASSAARNNDSWSQSARSDAGAPAPPAANTTASRPAAGQAGGMNPNARTFRPWGQWGGPPSISASSARRNNDSWSQSGVGDDDDDDDMPNVNNVVVQPPPAAPSAPAPASRAPSTSGSASKSKAKAKAKPSPARVDSPRPPPKTGAVQSQSWGAWGRAPSVSSSTAARNNDSWSRGTPSEAGAGSDARSVAESQGVGWGTSTSSQRGSQAGGSGSQASGQDGPWGSSDAVRAARPGKGKGAHTKTWAEEMDELDGRSVAASTESAKTWGNVSVGPW